MPRKPAITKDRIRSLVIQGNFYATMTWHNMPGGRRVQTTWMKAGSYPGMPFSQQMTAGSTSRSSCFPTKRISP